MTVSLFLLSGTPAVPSSNVVLKSHNSLLPDFTTGTPKNKQVLIATFVEDRQILLYHVISQILLSAVRQWGPSHVAGISFNAQL